MLRSKNLIYELSILSSYCGGVIMTAKSLIEQVAEERANERKENEIRESLLKKRAYWHSLGYVTLRLEGLEKKELAAMQEEYDKFERDLVELNTQRARLGELKRGAFEADIRGIEVNLANPDKISDIKRDITNLKKKIEKLDEKLREEAKEKELRAREQALTHEQHLKDHALAQEKELKEKAMAHEKYMKDQALAHELRLKEEQRLLSESQSKREEERRIRAEQEAKAREEETKKAQLAVQMKQEKRLQKEQELKEKKIKLMEMKAKKKEARRKGAKAPPQAEKKAQAPAAPAVSLSEQNGKEAEAKEHAAEAAPPEPPKAIEEPKKAEEKQTRKEMKAAKKAAMELVSPPLNPDDVPPEPILLNLSKKDSKIQIPLPATIDDWQGLFEYWDSPDAERLVPELEKLSDKDIATMMNWLNSDEAARSGCRKLILKWNSDSRYFMVYNQERNIIMVKRTYIGGLYTVCELLAGKTVSMYKDAIRYWQPILDLYNQNRPIYEFPALKKEEGVEDGDPVVRYSVER